MGQDDTNNTSTSGQENAPPETHVSARMDQIQNQLNQVLLMLQNQHGTSHGIFSSKVTKLPKFTTSLIPCLKVAWIIDSGATDHISISLKIMHSIHKCATPIIVSPLNGKTVQVTIVGLVRINEHITLTNVFYIPTFTFNIISISRLLHGTNISLILTTTLCIFQD